MAAEFYESKGTGVARPASMLRRIMAFLAMVAIVVIVVAVMLSVFHHHQRHVPPDEPTIVELSASLPLKA